MTLPRVYQTEAIILKRTKFGEADRIVTLYTPRLGKIKAIAKGACRPGSKLGGHIEPLTHSLIMLARGRNFDIITQTQTINSFLPLKNDLWRTTLALYACELVDSFTEERLQNHAIFVLLLNLFNWLCETKHRTPSEIKDFTGYYDGELALRYFELHLLNHLGYRPQLRQCVTCNSALQPISNFFSPHQGGVLCPKCRLQEPIARPLSVNALKVLRLWQDCDYATARRVKINPKLTLELEQVMREYIHYLLEREVKSTTFLDLLKKENFKTVDNLIRSD